MARMESKLGGCYSEPGWWLGRWRKVTDSRYVRGRTDGSGRLDVREALGREEGDTDITQGRVTGWMGGVPKTKKGRIWGEGYIFFIAWIFFELWPTTMDRTPRRMRHGPDPEKLEFIHIMERPVRLRQAQWEFRGQSGECEGRRNRTWPVWTGEGERSQLYIAAGPRLDLLYHSLPFPQSRMLGSMPGKLSQLSTLALLPSPV